jgi:hypothetical protein
VGTQIVTASNSGSQNVLWECILPQPCKSLLVDRKLNQIQNFEELVVDDVQPVDDINIWFYISIRASVLKLLESYHSWVISC